MKYILLLFAFLCSPINFAYSQTDCLKFELINFLKESKDLPDDIDSLEIANSILIINLDNPKVLYENEPGIYKFGTLTSHSSFHLLIVKNKKYDIVDMNTTLDSIILAIVDYYDMYQSQHTVIDITTSIKNAILLYNKNLDVVPWKIDKELNTNNYH